MHTLPTIFIFFTGGTISMKIDPKTGGAVPMLSGKEILAMVPEITSIANAVVVDFGRYPGPHMTPKLMLDLRNSIQSCIREQKPDGIVITHGTDSLEETAYFLDLTLNVSVPIVVTGAMSNASVPNWDGPQNLLDSIRVASDTRFSDFGVVVCLAGEINAASEVSKTHTSEAGTFYSFNFGSLSSIEGGTASAPRKPHHRDANVLGNIVHIDDNVALIKCYTGMSARLIDHVVDDGVHGLVVEAMGIGNVPPAAYDGIARAIETGVVVVLVSRCPIGTPEDVYAYYGAGKNLKRLGVIFADYLNGQKARIKLIAAFGKTRNREQIRSIFEWAEEETPKGRA